MADACPICHQPGPRHALLLHLVQQEQDGTPRCGCDPDEHDQTGPCIRAAGHTGVCMGRMLALCPACRHPWAGHELGEPDLSAPGAARDPDPRRPWSCPECECSAWAPYDSPPTLQAGELVMFGCREDDSAPHT